MDFFALSLGKALCDASTAIVYAARCSDPISHAPDRIRFATPSCCRARVQCEPAWGAALKPPRISHELHPPRRSQSAANTMGTLVVARLTARAVVVPIATITSTFSSRSQSPSGKGLSGRGWRDTEGLLNLLWNRDVDPDHSAAASPRRVALRNDLTDAEWALIEPLMPKPRARGRPREWPLREVLNAIL